MQRRAVAALLCLARAVDIVGGARLIAAA